MAEESQKSIALVPTKPEAEIAADLKRRVEEAIKPVLALMDEAASCGLQIQFDGIGRAPPYFRHIVQNLRIVKQY